MKALIWLGGFITGAASMLAVILWVLQDWEVVPHKDLVTMSADSVDGHYEVRGRLVNG